MVSDHYVMIYVLWKAATITNITGVNRVLCGSSNLEVNESKRKREIDVNISNN